MDGLVGNEAVWEVVVDIVHERCAVLDVSKKDAKVCVRVPGKRRGTFTSEVTAWGATTSQVLVLREFLLAAQVTVVVNARHVKNLPGRKTDVSDAQWLAPLGAHGLVRGSLVSPEPVRELRDLTRTRTRFTWERSREVQRLEELLEDAGIKLSSVASDILGVSGRAMLQALIAGQDDPAVLADLARRRMRSKIPELAEALTGRFREHHAFLARLHLEHIDRLTASIDALTARIEEVIVPFQPAPELPATIPGIARHTAEVIVAEIGGHIELFPTAGHLASWAGVAPGPARIGREGEIRPHQARQLLPQRRPGHRRVRRLPHPGHLPPGPPPAPVRPARPDARPGRRRALPADRDLAHAHHHQPLPCTSQGSVDPLLLLIVVRDLVDVPTERVRRVCLAEALRECDHVHAFRQSLRSIEMPERVHHLVAALLPQPAVSGGVAVDGFDHVGLLQYGFPVPVEGGR
jgi:transposase